MGHLLPSSARQVGAGGVTFGHGEHRRPPLTSCDAIYGPSGVILWRVFFCSNQSGGPLLPRAGASNFQRSRFKHGAPVRRPPARTAHWNLVMRRPLCEPPQQNVHGRTRCERRLTQRLMEARFGPLTPKLKQQVEALSPEALAQLQLNLLKAQALEELRLDD